MDARRAIIASLIALLIVLAYSASAVASQPAAPAAAPQPVPASETALITATGSAFVTTQTGDFVVSPQTLNITAQSKAAPADVDSAMAEMQQRLANIRGALEKLGVPSAGIMLQNLSVQPLFGALQPGQPSPVEKGQPIPQQIISFTINGSMTAVITDAKILVAAMNAVTANGATGLNVYPGKGQPQGNPQPPSDVLQKGLAEAIANAQATASVAAAASGKKLGDIHSVAVNQIYPACCPPGFGGWNIGVTVSWSIAP